MVFKVSASFVKGVLDQYRRNVGIYVCF